MPPSGPYLKAALLCEKLIEDKHGVLSAIRIVDRFVQTAVGPGAPTEMPPLRLSLTAVLMFVSGEAQGASEVRLDLEKPSGLSQNLGTTTVHFEGQDRGANIVVELELTLESQGLYWINVYVEEALFTRMPLRTVYGRSVPGPGRSTS